MLKPTTEEVSPSGLLCVATPDAGLVDTTVLVGLCGWLWLWYGDIYSLFEHRHIQAWYGAHYYTHYLLVSNNSVPLPSLLQKLGFRQMLAQAS